MRKQSRRGEAMPLMARRGGTWLQPFDATRLSSADSCGVRLAHARAGRVEAMKARLFARLRGHFQRRDRLRLVIGYRRKYLESLVRQGEEESWRIAQEYRQANAHCDRENTETAAARAEKQEVSAEEAASPRPLRVRAREAGDSSQADRGEWRGGRKSGIRRTCGYFCCSLSPLASQTPDNQGSGWGGIRTPVTFR